MTRRHFVQTNPFRPDDTKGSFAFIWANETCIKLIIAITISVSGNSFALAANDSPWGAAQESKISYKPQKVLYDLTTGDEKKFKNILDRISFLNNLYNGDPFESSIVIIVHGQSIPFFAIASFKKYEKIMSRVNSLTVGTTIEFRMCQASAKVQGFKPSDIHGFVKMVPMADAEIVKLQKDEGYAYMQ